MWESCGLEEILKNFLGGDNIFTEFPRKIGFPSQITVDSLEKALQMVDSANGYSDVYISLFSDSQRTFGNLDKVAFDIDDCDGVCEDCKSEKKRKCSIGDLGIVPDSFDTFDNVLLLHKYFVKDDIKHVIGFSGGGYHIYAKTDNRPLKNPNHALKECANNITRETNIKTDCSVFEIARIMRFPGTYNIKRQLWFVWVGEEDLQKGDKWIREKAETQHFEKPFIFGSRQLNLIPYDTKERIEMEEYKGTDSMKLKHIEIPPCIQRVLDDGFPDYRQRYFLILYLKEKGISFTETIQILNQYLSKEKFMHCCHEERQPQHIYNNKRLLFPKCKTLAREGFCVDRCKHYKKGSCIYLM